MKIQNTTATDFTLTFVHLKIKSSLLLYLLPYLCFLHCLWLSLLARIKLKTFAGLTCLSAPQQFFTMLSRLSILSRQASVTNSWFSLLRLRRSGAKLRWGAIDCCLSLLSCSLSRLSDFRKNSVYIIIFISNWAYLINGYLLN